MRLLVKKKRLPGMTLPSLEDVFGIVAVDHVGEQPVVTNIVRDEC